MSGDIPTMTQACAPPPDLQSVESDHSSSSGSQDPPPGAELLAKAVEQQNELGWTQFHQGRVSMLLAAVYYELNLGCQKSIGKSFWATNAERSILHYSLLLWQYRCQKLHGSTVEEARWIEASNLHATITQAYEEFRQDNFLILASLRCIFSAPLEERLLHDINTLKCFIATLTKGKLHQQNVQKKQSKAARIFFFPRSLPIEVFDLRGDGISSVSSLSVVTWSSTDSSHLSSRTSSLLGPNPSRDSLEAPRACPQELHCCLLCLFS